MPSSSLTARACYPKGSNIGGLGTMKKFLKQTIKLQKSRKVKRVGKGYPKRNQKRIPKEADRKRKPHIRNAIDKGQK